MKVYIVIKDETEHNGYRSILNVFSDRDMAEAAAEYEVEKAEDWCREMGTAMNWFPRCYVEEADFIE